MSMSQVLQNLSLNSLIKFQGLTYGKILKYNSDDYTADVQLLKFRKSRIGNSVKNVKYAKVFNIPILKQGSSTFSVKPDYKKDDIVVLAHSISEIDVKGNETSDKSKLLSKDNAVILGAINVTDTPALEITDDNIKINKNDIINIELTTDNIKITKSDTSSIEITDTEIILTLGVTKFTIDATGSTVDVAGVSVNLLTHTHPTPVGNSGPPVPGS